MPILQNLIGHDPILQLNPVKLLGMRSFFKPEGGHFRHDFFFWEFFDAIVTMCKPCEIVLHGKPSKIPSQSAQRHTMLRGFPLTFSGPTLPLTA
jgi:hypothetical protein